MRTRLITFLVITSAHIWAAESEKSLNQYELNKILQNSLPTEIVLQEEDNDDQNSLTDSEGVENFNNRLDELRISEARRKERRCNALLQAGLGLLCMGTSITEFWSMQYTDKVQNQSDDTIIKSALFFGGSTILLGMLGGAYKFEAASRLEGRSYLAKRYNALSMGTLALAVQSATATCAIMSPQASKWLLGAGGSLGTLVGLQFFYQIHKDHRTP